MCAMENRSKASDITLQNTVLCKKRKSFQYTVDEIMVFHGKRFEPIGLLDVAHSYTRKNGPEVVYGELLRDGAWTVPRVRQKSVPNTCPLLERNLTFNATSHCLRKRWDVQGELVFKAVSFTPFPVSEKEEGERIRIPVGPVGNTAPRTFLFEKLLPQPSELAAVTLERPLGIMIEEDQRKNRAIVADVAQGSRAEQCMRIAELDSRKKDSVVLPGDIVRAFTCTNLVYPTKSLLFGIKPPERHIVVYGADSQMWEKTASALRLGLRDDGPVTLIVERRSASQ